jgi:ATP-binding cassette subfamily C protein CydC
MLGAVGLGFVAVGAGIGLMATSGYLISAAALAPALGDLRLAIVGVRFFGVLRGVARYAERCVAHEVTFHLLARLRVWFYRSLEPLAPARLLDYRSGDLQTRIVSDIETLEHFFAGFIGPVLVAMLTTGLIGLILASHGLRLAGAACLMVLCAAILAGAVSMGLGRAPGRRLVALRAALRTRLVEGLQGGSDLLVFDRSARHREQTVRLAAQYERQHLRLASVRGLGLGLTGLGGDICVAACLAIAIPMVQSGGMDGVYLAVIVLTVSAGFEAVAPVPAAFGLLEKCLQASGRLRAIVDAEPPVREPSAPAPLSRPTDLRVRGLCFAYPSAPAMPVLCDVDLDLAPGRTVGVVGPNGAGKSTLIQILLRFWDYGQGSIQASGTDLKAISSDLLREAIGVVSQSTYLFTGTVEENIRMASPRASRARVEEAARTAGLHEFIQSLPDGYDTWVGELGQRLSGGERQRLAIARAVLKDAPVLILDEPTAHLDAVTAADVYGRVRAFARGRALLLITHRLTGLEWLDELAVMVDGRIVERGPARDLLARDGVFKGMYDIQAQALTSQQRDASRGEVP